MNRFDAQAYQAEVNAAAPRSKTLRMCIRAFVVGGLICCLGQGISDLGKLWFDLDTKAAGTLTAIVLVFLAALFTAIGIFDKLASFAGAGTVVPITGFSNSITAPAIEFRAEGLVMGVGAKLFTIAGPVLVYGISASIIVGLTYLVLGLV
ncbi:MAG: stage V sporulation protein AC [Clostridia bacterium]|nr:stage V sporulation protein AC [Clostridia bacterium]